MPQQSFLTSSEQPTQNVLVRETLSGKRVAIVGFALEEAMQLREVLESFDALCRIVRDETPGPLPGSVFDLVVVRQPHAASWAEQKGSTRRLVLGEYSELCNEIEVFNSPDRQYMLLPGSVHELLLRTTALLRSSPTSLPATTTSPTVVLADDDPSITTLLKTTLSRQKIACHVAQDGETALALTRQVRPQVLVLDVNMPHSDGFEVLSSVRNDPATQHVRVLMLTGCEQEMDILRGFGLGTDDYVTKPFNPMEVAARIKRLVEMSS